MSKCRRSIGHSVVTKATRARGCGRYYPVVNHRQSLHLRGRKDPPSFLSFPFSFSLLPPSFLSLSFLFPFSSLLSLLSLSFLSSFSSLPPSFPPPLLPLPSSSLLLLSSSLLSLSLFPLSFPSLFSLSPFLLSLFSPLLLFASGACGGLLSEAQNFSPLV